jgi:hypothetical protein
VPEATAVEPPHRAVVTSALAHELLRLRPAQRELLGIQQAAILLWNAIVSCAAALTDDADARPWQERLDALFTGAPEELSEVNLAQVVDYLNAGVADDIARWSEELKRIGLRRFLERMLGAGAYYRLRVALQKDSLIVTIALRRAARALMPVSVAFDDLMSVLPPTQLSKVPSLTGAPNALLSLFLQLDAALERAMEFGAPTSTVVEGSSDGGLNVEDLGVLAAQLREIVSGRSRESVTKLSAALGRKIKGARDALDYSADAIAQCANSLIELIDRLLRAAFTDEDVLDWLRANYRHLPDMTYVDDDGKTRPTKRAQALCFAHSGLPVSEPSPLHELAAVALVTTRSALQRLKHADRGTEDEQIEVRRYMAAVEGFLDLAVSLVWAIAPAEQVDGLRMRLEPSA